MTVEPAVPKRSGLAVAGDVIVAPGAAFQALRERTHWGWAYLIVAVLGLVGGYLQVPAGEHVAALTMQQSFAHDPKLAGLSPERQQQMIRFASVSQQYAWLFYPIVAIAAILISSFIFTVGNAAARGQATFSRLFGLSANVAIVWYGIGSISIGILCVLRGPQAFSNTKDLFTLLPSLAWLAPSTAPKLATLLSAINPLQIWSFILLALGLGTVARLPRAVCYALAAIVTFGSAIVPAALAK